MLQTQNTPATQMDNMREVFLQAHINEIPFVGIRVQMDGFPEDELIVNGYENIKPKMDYYEKTYGEDLQHKFSPTIRIVGFASGQSPDEVRNTLWK